MAIIKCWECNKDVSDKASTCPSCGAPIKLDLAAKENLPVVKKKRGSFWLLLLAGLFLLFLYTKRTMNPPPESPPTREISRYSMSKSDLNQLKSELPSDILIDENADIDPRINKVVADAVVTIARTKGYKCESISFLSPGLGNSYRLTPWCRRPARPGRAPRC